jgi:DNA polymerase I-like protein with 3'-5' exonuclease and polymerase domains
VDYPDDLCKFEVIALDTETTGLNWPADHMFGWSIATPEWEEYYDIRENPESLAWLRDQLARFQGLVVFHNASFDIKMLSSQGVTVNPLQVDDTSIRECLINEHRATRFPWTKTVSSYSLDALAADYLGETKVSDIYEALAAEFGGKPTRSAQILNLQRAPAELVRPYAIKDAQLTLGVWFAQNNEIKRQKLEQVLQFERDTFPHVLDQEMRGMRVDLDLARQTQNELHIEVDREKSKLVNIAGQPLNVNSTPQIRAYYNPIETPNGWTLSDGTPCGTTDKGNPSIDNDVLQSIAHRDPVAAQIIKIRSLIRTADTFLGKHILGHAVNGRVYPNINQVASEDGGTKTGRFSYVKPALQQIPNRNKAIAAKVKPCFLPDEGQVWLDCDKNSFEVRVFGHLVGRFNSSLVDQYKADPNTDLHEWVAGLMGVPRNPTATGGANAKQLNLSMIFNSGKGAIAKRLGMPTTPDEFEDEYGHVIKFDRSGPEGEVVIKRYHKHMQGVNALVDEAKKRAIRRGYLRTMYGRHLRFPRKYKVFKASGILIQATAADINKENWHIINNELGDRGRLMLNTHDSYSLSVDEDKVGEAWRDVKRGIERPLLRVPLILDLNGVGDNWWAALQGVDNNACNKYGINP